MTNRPHPESERRMHRPLQHFDLEAELARLREERAFSEGRRNAITLRKGESMNVVLMAMKAGDRLKEHAAPGPPSPSAYARAASASRRRARWSKPGRRP